MALEAEVQESLAHARAFSSRSDNIATLVNRSRAISKCSDPCYAGVTIVMAQRIRSRGCTDEESTASAELAVFTATPRDDGTAIMRKCNRVIIATCDLLDGHRHESPLWLPLPYGSLLPCVACRAGFGRPQPKLLPTVTSPCVNIACCSHSRRVPGVIATAGAHVDNRRGQGDWRCTEGASAPATELAKPIARFLLRLILGP